VVSPVALDLVTQTGEVAAELGGQLCHGPGAECLDLGLVQRGQGRGVVDPGAAALGTVGIARGDGDDVGVASRTVQSECGSRRSGSARR
jgi:hypothetical protein